MTETNRQPKFKHAQYVKLARLIDMLYKPAEIAHELDVSTDTVYRSYLPAGCPYTRDKKNNIWIHGRSFSAWAKEYIGSKKKNRQPMPDGFAWCLRCNKTVPLIDPKPKRANRYVQIMQAKCPNCGTTVNRAVSSRISKMPPNKAKTA